MSGMQIRQVDKLEDRRTHQVGKMEIGELAGRPTRGRQTHRLANSPGPKSRALDSSS